MYGVQELLKSQVIKSALPLIVKMARVLKKIFKYAIKSYNGHTSFTSKRKID